MKKFLLFVLIPVLLAGCGSGGGGGRPPDPPTRPTQAFAIVVKDFVRPEVPVAGVSVQCEPEVLRGTTNEDGYVAFTATSNIVYNCTFEKEGYETGAAAHYLTPDSPELYVPLTAVAPPRPEPTPTPSPLVGRLRIEGSCYRDDTGCVNPLYAHSGDMFSRFTRDPDYVRGQLDKVAGAGYHGVRFWTILGGNYWRGREVGPNVTPDYWGQLNAFLDELALRKLRAVFSLGDIGQLGGSRQSYMGGVVSADGDSRVIDFIDCGNEAFITGESDPQKLSECVSYYRNAGGTALLTLTSSPTELKEDIDKYSIPPADAFDVHGYRGGNFWDKFRHIFSISYEAKPAKRLGIQSEPFGNGGLVSVTSNKDQLNEEAMAAGAVMSYISRQAWVWFSGEGVILQRGLETQFGFASSPKAVALLPKDITTFPLIHHSGTSWAGVRLLVPPRDDVRIDGVQNGNRAVQLIYGPNGTYNFQVTKDFVGKLCNPGTGECEDVDWQGGLRVNIGFDRARLLIGEIR